MDIYTITTFQNFKVQDKEMSWGYSYDSERTPGYFTAFEDAKEVVENNAGDINEAFTYDHVVIERHEEGLYGLTNEQYWYKWNKDENRYTPIPNPVRHLVGWGIG